MQLRGGRCGVSVDATWPRRPVRPDLRRVRCRENGSFQADPAVHCQHVSIVIINVTNNSVSSWWRWFWQRWSTAIETECERQCTPRQGPTSSVEPDTWSSYLFTL